ncbi:hypothetical protein BKA66DRAFT_416903 [Pyrenochaeta sp. MPI-SDFR-AT-0127]|nr:hypothetical protein BKA66DRAFT_416903 [Pyrenochaeta sp. MPI-SDFR-AT-0127]
MAASNLMNECKLLENAPEFAKSRPEAYLDNVKTEYAAKLAVCELLSAQPINPIPPPYCDILVPSPKACGKRGSWWYTKPETRDDKPCYPEFKDQLYTQCLKSLQSTPQYWTSFSNARQNAVVMCQASRDSIERENHLETFKNVTEVLGIVTSNLQKATEDYESFIRQSRHFSKEARNSHYQLKEEIQIVQEKAIAAVGALDEKFHAFLNLSISELITALAYSQNIEIERIHQRMQHFSQDIMVESTLLAKFLNDELRQFHSASLSSLKDHHQMQVDSYNVLSSHMDAVYVTVNKTNEIADMSLSTAETIAQRLRNFESQTENLTEGFAFLSSLSALATFFIRAIVAMIGALFIFIVLHKLNRRLAAYSVGACSSAFLLYTCGVFNWIENLVSIVTNIHNQRSLMAMASLSSTHMGAGIVLLLWISAYPVVRINSFLGFIISSIFKRLVRPFWVRQYRNDGGIGFLPGVEIPIRIHEGKFNTINN